MQLWCSLDFFLKFFVEIVVAVKTVTVTLQANSMVCGSSGGSRDSYHDLTGQ